MPLIRSSRIIGNSPCKASKRVAEPLRHAAAVVAAILPLRSSAPPHIRPPSPADFRRTCSACVPGRRLLATSGAVDHRSAGDAAGESLGQRHDVGLHGRLLISEPAPRCGPCPFALRRRSAAAVLVRQLPQAAQKLRPRQYDAPFALNRLEQDRRTSRRRSGRCTASRSLSGA